MGMDKTTSTPNFDDYFSAQVESAFQPYQLQIMRNALINNCGLSKKEVYNYSTFELVTIFEAVEPAIVEANTKKRNKAGIMLAVMTLPLIGWLVMVSAGILPIM